MRRRDFLKSTATATACAVAAPFVFGQTPVTRALNPSAARLPRWRGFNLLEMFVKGRDEVSKFRETDFEIMQEWGFDFARLPMSYHCWSLPDPMRWLEMDEAQLKRVDEAVELGRKHGIHVNLNLHRAPGYCVNPPLEPLNLWTDEKALDACAFHWAHFARRYRGIPNSRVSFDLLNEPSDIPEPSYARVIKRLVEAIRAEDSQRLIIADGLKWGNQPVHSLVDLQIAQSTRGYQPPRISHYKANWMKGSDTWPEPTWPLKIKEGDVWDKTRLHKLDIAPWKELEMKGVGVHVGEWGAFNRTPHRVVLAWMRDQLELWKAAEWGWAMWNLRGAFGPLDSGRADVDYDDFRGHKLDRAMLKLIQEF
jgi:endoglucanase